MLLVLQRHQYTLDRPFSYDYSQPWLVAGVTTAILPSLAVPLEGFIKQQSIFHNLSQSNVKNMLVFFFLTLAIEHSGCKMQTNLSVYFIGNLMWTVSVSYSS